MIEECKSQEIHDCQARYPENFPGLGKIKNHKVKPHINSSNKPVTVQQRSIPYHLKEQADQALNKMIKDDVIEPHSENDPAPLIPNVVIAPKPDGNIRLILDPRNLSKTIDSTNLPIPQHEDIKVKLTGCKIFSNMDFKTAFWQIEIEEESRHLTVFYANGKLYQYKRLTMRLKPLQGELNTALKPVFSHISNVHLIHDDLIVATKIEKEHVKAIKEL